MMSKFQLALALLIAVCAVSEAQRPECLLPKHEGHSACQADLQKYYFDPINQRCLPFTYSGCGGNKNNWEKEDCECYCENRCAGSTDNVNPICLQRVDIGYCHRELDRWYFNSVNLTCMEFKWTGCGGNTNKFFTYEQCERDCRQVGPPTTQCTSCNRVCPTGYTLTPLGITDSNGCPICECRPPTPPTNCQSCFDITPSNCIRGFQIYQQHSSTCCDCVNCPLYQCRACPAGQYPVSVANSQNGCWQCICSSTPGTGVPAPSPGPFPVPVPNPFPPPVPVPVPVPSPNPGGCAMVFCPRCFPPQQRTLREQNGCPIFCGCA